MEKDKTLKKGEKVKNERNELVKMLKDEPQRLVFKTLGTYATVSFSTSKRTGTFRFKSDGFYAMSHLLCEKRIQPSICSCTS